MFTKEELKEILNGIDLKIAKVKGIYSEKIKLADERGWVISKAAMNSIDYVSNKIKQLEQLRKKIYEEINWEEKESL